MNRLRLYRLNLAGRRFGRLLIFDAVDFGMEPATLRMVQGEDVPRFMGAKKVSMHQAGFQEVLSSATLSRALPEELVLIGVQPELLDDYGGSLTAGVKARIDEAVELAKRFGSANSSQFVNGILDRVARDKLKL